MTHPESQKHYCEQYHCIGRTCWKNIC